MYMKQHTQQAIIAHSNDAIHQLNNLYSLLFEVSVELPIGSRELTAVEADLRRITQIIKQIEDLDVNSNPFGLSNFPFCNKQKS
jgi:phosphate uptake regulator